MTEDGISDSYDVVVYGTGLSESIVAAACAKAGLTVFHFDKNGFYGGSWASFNLEQITEWVSTFQSSFDGESGQSATGELENIAQLKENERLILPKHAPEFSNVEMEWLVEDDQPSTTQEDQPVSTDIPVPVWTKPRILEQARRFSLDLTPKVLFSTGSAIDALINSKVSRYAEFKLVDRILTITNDELKIVPCSRSDVFQTDQLNLIEKRLLMKVLEQRAQWTIDESQDFPSFLAAQNLSPKLQHYILYALANGNRKTKTGEALKSINKFLNSVGRYGNSPFLWTLYGSGELPQCFCRMCAVFGGIYCLRMPLQGLIIDDDKKIVSAVLTDNKRINCNKKFVSSQVLVNDQKQDDNDALLISKAILITDKSILNDVKDHISYLNVELEGSRDSIKLLEVSPSGMACPKGLCVVYLSTSNVDGPKKDFHELMQKLFAPNDATKPKILWSLTLNQRISAYSNNLLHSCSNFIPVTLPDDRFDYDGVIDEISSIFTANFENIEFFPLMPDENEDEDHTVQNSSESTNSAYPELVDQTCSPESKKIDSHNVL